MKNGLLIKTIGAILAFLILGFILVSTVVTASYDARTTNLEADRLYKAALTLANNYASDFKPISEVSDSLSLDFSKYQTLMDAEIWLINKNGKILASGSKNPAPGEFIDDFSITYFGNSYYKTGTFFDYFKDKKLTVFAPIIVNYNVSGYIVIHKSMSIIDGYSGIYLNLSYYALILLFVIGAVLVLIFFLTTYLPIRSMRNVARKYMNGDFTAYMKNTGVDELGFLASSFNYMADELNNLEDDQRKFVSNISHDFRSPLTSIRGYIEAILDGTIPPEMHEKYLNVILSETERLTNLTNSLIDLNKFGSHGRLMLDVSKFDLNDVIRQTAATFEGRCIEKHISIRLVLFDEELNVRADKTRIQQVIYNITDNAIKFSKENSDIKIETTVKGDKAYISIKDNGVGIPKESINKIWERFYKTDASRGKDKKGSGIGLAIVKDIIQAHNENIHVISTEGIGTEFVFTLTLVDDE